MIRKGLLLTVAVLALALRPAPASATLGFSVDCSPGIPSCGSLRFFLSATGNEFAVNDLFVKITSPGWTFVSGGTPGVGSYSAQDSFGPFSGFTSIGGAGTSLFIDFAGDLGFPMDILAGDTGILDVEDNGPGTAQGLYLSYSGHDVTGEPFSGTVTPEPISLTLLASGLAGLALKRRKRAAEAQA